MKVDVADIIGLTLIILIWAVFGYGLGYMHCEEKMKKNRYDVNLDGEINAADYVVIRDYIMESE